MSHPAWEPPPRRLATPGRRGTKNSRSLLLFHVSLLLAHVALVAAAHVAFVLLLPLLHVAAAVLHVVAGVRHRPRTGNQHRHRQKHHSNKLHVALLGVVRCRTVRPVLSIRRRRVAVTA